MAVLRQLPRQMHRAPYDRNMRSRNFAICLGGLLLLCAGPLLAQSLPGARSQRSHEVIPPGNQSAVGSFALPDGSRFVTTLYDLKVVGKLRTKKKLPYYILSGIGCTECDANTSIYIHSPSDGPMKNEGEQQRFMYPGQERDYQTGQIVYEGRMFYGDCLPDHPNAVVWFERMLGDDKKLHDDVFVAEVKQDHLLTTKLPTRELPKPKDSEVAVRAGKCHELGGKRSYREP